MLLLGPIGPKTVERFLEEEPLRSRVALLDLARLEKIVAVRSSVFVYLEWFLRDTYGVKILPESAFTSGLVGARDHLARHGLGRFSLRRRALRGARCSIPPPRVGAVPLSPAVEATGSWRTPP